MSKKDVEQLSSSGKRAHDRRGKGSVAATKGDDGGKGGEDGQRKSAQDGKSWEIERKDVVVVDAVGEAKKLAETT